MLDRVKNHPFDNLYFQ